MLERIGYAVVFVKGWDEAMRFYADTLGLEAVRRHDEGGFAEFRFPAGGPNLLVEQVDKTDVEAHALVGQFVGLSVTVRDIRRSYDHLSAKGVCFEAPPSRQGWGGSRTWSGARAQSVLMSVWRTCWQQGRSALDFLSQLLRGTMVALVLPP